MKKAKYRIKEVTIEGFRGFTVPQKVVFDGKNLFVFGPNGCGKSSIVEAIRWCLFGAPGSDIEFRNTFYEIGECCVDLVLVGSEGTLSIRRELRPGHDRTRQTIRSATGEEVLARDALPQLAQLGPRGGTQVIFAAQHAAGRQVPADISNLITVLCVYLGLDDVQKLLQGMKNLQDERQDEADKLAKSLEVIEQKYREELGAVKALLNGVHANPPWGDETPPTGSETDQRVNDLVARLVRLFDEEPRDDASPEESLAQAEQWIVAAAKRETSEFETTRNTLASKLEKADELVPQWEQAQRERETRALRKAEVERHLAVLLGGHDRDALARQLQELERGETEREARSVIAERAKAFCEAYEVKSCPVCATEIDPTALMDAINVQCDETGPSEKATSAVEELRERVTSIRGLDEELEDLEVAIATGQESATKLGGVLAGVLGNDVVDSGLETVTSYLAQLRGDVADLQRQTGDADAEKQRRIKDVRALQLEQRFHQYRDRVEDYQWRLESGLQDARDLLKDYCDLLARTDEVRTLVEQSFNEALDKAVPRLNQMFTEVYGRLTQQKSYDKVCVYRDPEKSESLELRVASTRLEGLTFPANVLNGQASKAIHLVPYFVFSQFQPELMELELLLIDDPSESFDTSHVELLVQQLGEAARHAQVVVASHEQEKFQPHLDKYFSEEPYLVLSVDDFDPLKGPRLVCQ